MSSTPKITTTTGLEKWIPAPRQQANCGDNLYARAEKKGKVYATVTEKRAGVRLEYSRVNLAGLMQRQCVRQLQRLANWVQTRQK
jgi:hypothetical protein